MALFVGAGAGVGAYGYNEAAKRGILGDRAPWVDGADKIVALVGAATTGVCATLPRNKLVAFATTAAVFTVAMHSSTVENCLAARGLLSYNEKSEKSRVNESLENSEESIGPQPKCGDNKCTGPCGSKKTGDINSGSSRA